MKKYSIVIPTYNHCDDLLKPCIESILSNTELSNLEIVVVANGCTDNTREYVNSLHERFPNGSPSICLVWIDDAVGYTKATNAGILAATGDYVVLLNNDTLILEQPKNLWIDMMAEKFLDESVGMVGPLGLYDKYADAHVIIFFCVMIKKEVFNTIGFLDEVFSPGGGEDIDFTIRARNAGFKAVAIESQYNGATNTGGMPIWHKDNKTFGEIPEYTNYIIKRNGLINCKRYNKNIKLNLGSAGIEHDGYLSVDLYDKRANILMDITKLDFEDNSVTEILASHVFEHLNPYHSLDILRDWHRVLKPGGRLIMEMPDIEQLCKRFVTASTGERYGILNAIYGSVNTTNEGTPDQITSPHLFGWWPQSLWDHLTNAGFKNIEFMPEKIPHPESNLRVEAIK
jgi:GT2 family glycosyltransferase